ncbi:MAG: copper homeostasis protein CutC [Salinivirgaceae bacterium]|nr:copper homeostasis protein CutC [Salinivirgaceae bacterium]
MQQIILEACVETLSQAVHAEQKGAHRIELCADLDKDGLTPSLSLIQDVKAAVSIPIKVMIRPREGNYVYTPTEIQQMKHSIFKCKEAGVFGVVFGFLKKNNSIDFIRTRELSKLAKPLNVTFHKAIDLTNNTVEETIILSSIKELDAILTSGKAEMALNGAIVINKMIEAAADNIKIIAAGKITNENLSELKNKLKTNEFHGKRIVGNIE